jgi:hypothetical protein
MEEYLKNLFGIGSGGFFGSQGAGLIGALGQAGLTEKAMQDIGQARQEANIFFGGATDLPTYEGGLLGEVARQSQFKPFTVTGTNVFGQPSAATISQTGTELALSPEEAQLQRSLTGFGQGAFDFLGDPMARGEEQTNIIGMLTQDPAQRAGREADIFQRLEAVQAPERERARLQLEERLLGQGRSGVQTAMFGGTPEQLALNKAIEEQRAASAVSAMEQARAEQALQSQQTLQGLGEFRGRMGLLGQLGLQAIPTAYTPQQELLRTLTPQLEASRLASSLQATGLGLGAGLAESAIESQLGFEALRNALRQQQYQGLFDLLSAERRGQSSGTTTTTTSGGSGSNNFFENLVNDYLTQTPYMTNQEVTDLIGVPMPKPDLTSGTQPYMTKEEIERLTGVKLS